MTKPHPDVTLARFAARNHGLFTRSDALLAGLSNAAIGRRLRSGEWLRVYKNVYCMASAPRTWHLRVLALCLRRPGAVWASGRTAGLLWQLDGCDHEVVEVVSTENIRGREEVVVHRVRDMPRHHTTFIGRIPVTTVHRTLADLGSVADPDIVELALECALRRGLTNPDRLQRVISDLGTAGRRGTAALAAILRAHEGRPTESSLETMFVQFLRRNGISAPTRQHAVTDHNGFLARVDFFWDDRMVVVEVDSRSHHLRREQWEKDLRRRNGLTARSYRVLHVTHRRLMTDRVALGSEIKRVLKATRYRGLYPPSRSAHFDDNTS